MQNGAPVNDMIPSVYVFGILCMFVCKMFAMFICFAVSKDVYWRNHRDTHRHTHTPSQNKQRLTVHQGSLGFAEDKRQLLPWEKKQCLRTELPAQPWSSLRGLK